MHDFCEYVRNLVSMSEVLDANAASTVCTTTQCFDDWTAIVPMHQPHDAPATDAGWWMAMVALLAFLALLGAPVARQTTDSSPLAKPAFLSDGADRREEDRAS